MESPAFFLEHKKLLFHSHFNLVVSSYMLDAFSLFLDFNFFFFASARSTSPNGYEIEIWGSCFPLVKFHPGTHFLDV